MSQPLSGVRVIEVGGGIPVGYAGRLFALYGADVIRVEPPSGDPARLVGPFPSPDEDPEQGSLHLHLGVNKRSIVVPLDTAEGRTQLAELGRWADVVLDASPPGSLAVDLDAAVVVRVTPFGLDGPYAGFKGGDLLAYALGGPMQSTGIEDREPIGLGGHQTAYQCGNVAALAALAALALVGQDGPAVTVDVSNLETQVGSIDRRTSYLLYHQWTGRVGEREPSNRRLSVPAGIYPTADGYVQILTIPSWVPRMLEVLDDPDLAAAYAKPGWPTDPELHDLKDAALYPWLLERTRFEAAAEGQAHRWPVTPLNAPVDLVEDPHFAARGFWAEVDHPVAGLLRQPGRPFRVGAAADPPLRPAPTLGQHNADLAELAAAPRPPRSPRQAPDLPLRGIRVLDMTVVWAGPYATMFLADLGAEVIRVDNPYVWPTATRGDGPRPAAAQVPTAGPLRSYPNDDPGDRPWNRHSMYSAHARNKLGATLDLRTDLGRETFLRLVERSDVLVENNSVGVLDKLGIGWEVLHRRNPKLVCVRLPPMGLDGPYADWLGFGAHFEALCGLTALRGYPDLDPSVIAPVFHMDPATGVTGAFATLAALRERDRTGAGMLVELCQAENMMQHIGEFLVDAARTGRRHGPMANRSIHRAPQGCYPCAGQDRWVVVSIGDDAEWAGLVRAMGSPAWASEDRFAAVAGRRSHHDDLDRLIGAWTAGLDAYEVFRRCQAEGAPAAPVLDEAACLADPHLRARGFFRRNGSVDLGEWEFPNHLWRWNGPPLQWGPLCRLGADNDYVYRTVMGLSDAEYQALDEAGHLSMDYLQPDGTPF